MKNNLAKNNEDNNVNELIDKLVHINRVVKVVKGGRRFSFSALVVVGDGKGCVAFGFGKAKEVPDAIRKAVEVAKKSFIKVPLLKGRAIHHDIRGKFDAGSVFIRSAKQGTGIIAGGPMRAIFEVLGVSDVVAKCIGSRNPHNIVRATFDALKQLENPKTVALRRGKKVSDIIAQRAIANKRFVNRNANTNIKQENQSDVN